MYNHSTFALLYRPLCALTLFASASYPLLPFTNCHVFVFRPGRAYEKLEVDRSVAKCRSINS